MTTIVAGQGVLMADRLCVSTIKPPLRHANTLEEFYIASANTDKLYFLDRTSEGGMYDADNRIKCFGVSGDAHWVNRFCGLLDTYTLVQIVAMTKDLVNLRVPLSVLGYLEDGRVFQLMNEGDEGSHLELFPLDESEHGVFTIGSGSQIIEGVNKVGSIVKTPLDAMLLAASYDPYTSNAFDYIVIKDMTWVRNAHLSKRQKDLALAKIESRFRLDRNPKCFPMTAGRDGPVTIVERV